uniref:Uncharacterized protein n=1 Tax=Pyrodinium bahamense TaxID=73915 RepID=A0A7R9ZUS4_9DINO|mmetsp:Transcript_10402/g.28940  ORF Transcript_10402/g.28940 Transcript_10402/m.28940 type:complete len:337 (+) Transcript_10402:89-1099(+)
MYAPQIGSAPLQYGQTYPQGYGTTANPLYEQLPVPAEHGHGLLGLQRKMPFLRMPRRRMNVAPILLCLFVPWALFVLVFAVSSFSLHYNNPWAYDVIIAVCALAVLITLAVGFSRRLKSFYSEEAEPSWLIFLALSMLVAFVGGVTVGDSNYSQYMRPYFDYHNLNFYTNVYPNRMRGQQLMDAGSILFADGSYLDISRSMGFKKGGVYCVAPITFGNQTLPTYDFWAVGINCCSGNQADFHCAGWNSPKSSGGLRIMSGDDRGFYRLAVQQAEAAYGIKAVHPLFFTWVIEPVKEVEGWRGTARNSFLIWIMSYLLLQAFLVTVAALAFSRIGRF